MRTRLHNVPTGAPFMIPGSDVVYEHRGNGWHQIYGKTETGGPWHISDDTIVDVDDNACHPSQSLSCFV